MINYGAVRFDLPNRGYWILDAYLNVRRNVIACCNSFLLLRLHWPLSRDMRTTIQRKNKLALKYPSKGWRTTVSWFQLSAISSSVIDLKTTVRFFAAADLPVKSSRCAILPDWDAHNVPMIAISFFCRVRFYFVVLFQGYENALLMNSMTKVVSLITRDGVDTRKIGIKRWNSRTD